MKRGKPQRKISKTAKKTKPKHVIKRRKPRIKVTIIKKTLGKAPEKYSFYLEDGRKIRSVYELIDELETMTEETFKHYVTETHNHFANWINDVFGEKTLAEEIRHIHHRIDTQRALLKHLVRELTKENAAKRKA
ncbi:hypothetical protein KY309_01705 [Candidatus Woesearchaeota archaeon]|nr:hypothetical protein [Candidatus Woesearchaeota archaeon]MBW3016304.1 hypothetical protein [Candidatus Woesearchaeota archaeon]